MKELVKKQIKLTLEKRALRKKLAAIAKEKDATKKQIKEIEAHN